jgi:hypothetical protein
MRLVLDMPMAPSDRSWQNSWADKPRRHARHNLNDLCANTTLARIAEIHWGMTAQKNVMASKH